MIIHDFLDNDLYKFTTMNAIQKKFPNAEVLYKFINRGKTVFPTGFAEELRKEVDAMKDLLLTDEGEAFLLNKCYFCIRMILHSSPYLLIYLVMVYLHFQKQD